MQLWFFQITVGRKPRKCTCDDVSKNFSGKVVNVVAALLHDSDLCCEGPQMTTLQKLQFQTLCVPSIPALCLRHDGSAMGAFKLIQLEDGLPPKDHGRSHQHDDVWMCA
jgi:hypothetical protein